MYKCNKCNKQFSTKRGLSSHLKFHLNLKYITKKQVMYEKTPKLCMECNGAIPYKSYCNSNKIEFCSCSCRATFFNKKHYLSSQKTIISDK